MLLIVLHFISSLHMTLVLLPSETSCEVLDKDNRQPGGGAAAKEWADDVAASLTSRRFKQVHTS